jgi:hydrogenase-4 component B
LDLDWIGVAFWIWFAAAIVALATPWRGLARLLLGLGCVAGVVAALVDLPAASAPLSTGIGLAGHAVRLRFDPAALWLLGFGLAAAALACWSGSPRAQTPRAWLFGCALSLIGALGVFGLQDGVSFLVAWELMSFGGALMILGEQLGSATGRSVLFMLALLEVGAVALLAAVLLFAAGAGDASFAAFAPAAVDLSSVGMLLLALLLLVGFGAKLGLLPFYEWFPRSYANASGATGALMSGVVLNAAFYALGRGYVEWLAPQASSGAAFGLGVIVVAVGVASAILAILYAFQQDDWRSLLSFSSAENAAVAVTLLGACLLFRNEGLNDLAGLAWTVALLHLAGHSLAKGALFLTADSVYCASGSYDIVQRGWLRRRGATLGVGALFAAMSLAAIPPQAGFVSEWYTFQTLFQGFHLATFTGRLVLALAGAGLALTAAIALANFVKVFGLGLLGAGEQPPQRPAPGLGIAVGLLGLGVLALAVGMPIWLGALVQSNQVLFGSESARLMTSGWLLVPLTAKFAFISPSLLVIVMPLLALVPIGLVFAFRRAPVRRAPVWYGGMPEDSAAVATTSLSFSSALRTFYSFIYRPIALTRREHTGREYFVKRLAFDHDVAPIFGPTLFEPATRLIQTLAAKLRALQSGNLNFYLALIGGLWIVILALSLV